MNNKFVNDILEKYEFDSIHEMIFELTPKGYNIPSAFITIPEVSMCPKGSQVTLFGYIDSFKIQTKGITQIKARVCNNGDCATLIWITSPKVAKKMKYGLEQQASNNALVQVTGKIDQFNVGQGQVFKFISQAKLTKVEENVTDTNNQMQFIVPEPLYKLKEGFKENQIKLAFKAIVENWDSLYKDNFMPTELEPLLGMKSLLPSLSYLHGLNPIKAEQFQAFLESDKMRRRVLVEKIWTIMKNGYSNRQLSGNPNFDLNDKDILNIKVVLDKLHFELTGDQKKAIWGMLKYFEQKVGSKSLVFGDVGSGKTLVALVTAYVLYKRGFQVAILAPTSILAKQHFEEAIELFPEEDFFIVHSKTKKKEKDQINAFLETSKAAIVYGTTSLNRLNFKKLGLIIIDEEQKFGVHDKEVLYKASNNQAHVVSMSATPIPRTLASAMFSDAESFRIEQKPAMQKPRITKLINIKDMDPMEVEAIRERMRNKEQTLIIVPSIVSNDLISVKTAEEKYSKIFPGFKIDTINGRMKPENIEKTTEEFMAGNIDILIATTMVDAGFSNKMLSHVFIENADRFGIAQLHQIRGRVGRGKLQGYCYLTPNGEIHSLKENTRERLMSLVESENGFELSMKDISLRGSGDLRGVKQSGSDVDLIEWAKEVEIISNYLKSKN